MAAARTSTDPIPANGESKQGLKRKRKKRARMLTPLLSLFHLQTSDSAADSFIYSINFRCMDWARVRLAREAVEGGRGL